MHLKKLHPSHHSEVLKVASFLMNVPDITIPCEILNLLFEKTVQNSILSVFNCYNFLKNSRETILIIKLNSILPENLALHP